MLRQVIAAVKSREQEVIHRQAIPDNVREERLVPMEVPRVRPVTLWPLCSTWIPQPGAQNPQKKTFLGADDGASYFSTEGGSDLEPQLSTKLADAFFKAADTDC